MEKKHCIMIVSLFMVLYVHGHFYAYQGGYKNFNFYASFYRGYAVGDQHKSVEL